MSNRTAESIKAIREAWKNEQELVLEGKGTRDWSIEQQNDIISKGKAYDENGVAFQGQHMKSAEKYPDYQGDPGNIQFLTKDEHLEAHGGDWRKPTNWYFDPVTKEKIDFGDGPFIPCEVISLTESVVLHSSETVGAHSEPESNEKENFDAQVSDQAPPQKENTHEQIRVDRASSAPKVASKPEEFLKFLAKTAKGFVRFAKKHPEEVIALSFTIAGAVAAAVSRNAGSGSGSGSDDNGGGQDDASFSLVPEDDVILSDNTDAPVNEPDVPEAPPVDRNYPDTHASPKEHIVPAGGQHYHTKKGTIYKEKGPYRRGGKKDDAQ